VLTASFGVILADHVTAQTFTTLHSFTGGSDGGWPFAGLILSGNMLYGTAAVGGTSGNGTVFAVKTDGTGFTNLHSFSDSDGSSPNARLILSRDILYGTASHGGSSGNGTVFTINTNGIGFMVLHNFTATPGRTNSDGINPQAGLVLSGNTLYGTTWQGGSGGWGTVFAVNTDSTGFTNLYNFTGGSDGAGPTAGLILSGNTLYGTASHGGSSGNGTVFRVNINGTNFANLHSFTALDKSTNTDGANPNADLILTNNILYGTAQSGGSGGEGTVFKVNIDGNGFTTLYSFTAIPAYAGPHTNSDGTSPNGLILSGNTLYGTAQFGGSSNSGTVFSIFIQPQLAIISLGTDVVLTWPTNYAGFTLQSVTNLVSPSIWTTVTPEPVVVNGQNTVTNPISGTQQFFRLSQ